VSVHIVPMRWWHIERLLPIEDELFGAEQWPAATFWSELAEAPTRYYRVLIESPDTTGPDTTGPITTGAITTSPDTTGPSANGPSTNGRDRDGRDTGSGDIVGYGGLCTYGDESWVQNIAVRRDHQGRRLGALLLDDLLAEAARRRSVHVALEVRADNVTAQRLYARRGFEQVAVRRGYYQPSNTDALVMVREGSARA
jgi:ribosomal-protein-alanine N-acetyltransferase